jgi:undecaprenyl-diphosphatase
MSSTVSILTVFVYFYKKYWIVWTSAILFALLMAFARIHNGMHYPTDVLAGTALGIVYGIIAIKSQKLL